MKKNKIYFGAPLFSEMEQMYNEKLVKNIRDVFGDSVDVYLPQENEALNDKSGYASAQMIADGDNQHLEESDILIAVIDGQTMDVGLASEIGYFYGMNKPIIALYTDVRQGTHGNQKKIDALDEVGENQFAYANLYTLGLIKNRGKIVTSSYELMSELNEIASQKRTQDE